MKTYLDVPQEQSHRAQAKGALYDMSSKKWYCPDGVDLALFREWLPHEIRKWFATTVGATKKEAKNARHKKKFAIRDRRRKEKVDQFWRP